MHCHACCVLWSSGAAQTGNSLMHRCARSASLACVEAVAPHTPAEMYKAVNNVRARHILFALHCLQLAVAHTHTSCARPHLQKQQGWTPLHMAAFGGNVAIAQFVAARGAPIRLRDRVRCIVEGLLCAAAAVCTQHTLAFATTTTAAPPDSLAPSGRFGSSRGCLVAGAGRRALGSVQVCR